MKANLSSSDNQDGEQSMYSEFIKWKELAESGLNPVTDTTVIKATGAEDQQLQNEKLFNSMRPTMPMVRQDESKRKKMSNNIADQLEKARRRDFEGGVTDFDAVKIR